MYKNPYVKIKPKTKRPYTEIFLIRHCHPDYSLEKKVGEYNMPLSKIGLKERKYLTKRLLKMNIARAYTSNLQRSKETAADFLKRAKLKGRVSERLDEINWKYWYRMKYFNMSEAERAKRFEKYHLLDKALDRMQASVRETMAAIFKENRGKRGAIFTHGNLIKSLITSVLSADVIGFLSLEIFQSSITKLVIDRDGYVKIAFINDVSHLPSPPDKDIFISLVD